MNFLNNQHFWTYFWSVFVISVTTILVVMDLIAVHNGHKDKLGDAFSLTHWLVTKVGISIIGALIGYLIAHFLIVHVRG